MSRTGIAESDFLTYELYGLEDVLDGTGAELNARAAIGPALDIGTGIPGIWGFDVENYAQL